jgi:hypothetical protein
MAKAKKDDGIATIQSKDSTGKVTKLKIEEAVRDALQKHDFSAGPRRKADPNFVDYSKMSTAELERAEWSGIRQNDFTMNVELWVLGRIAVKRSYIEIARNPACLATMHEEAFKTTGTVIQTDVSKGASNKLH